MPFSPNGLYDRRWVKNAYSDRQFYAFSGLATNYLLLVGLAADLLGIVALKYFTPKNDYITISIKFGTRLLIFAVRSS